MYGSFVWGVVYAKNDALKCITKKYIQFTNLCLYSYNFSSKMNILMIFRIHQDNIILNSYHSIHYFHQHSKQQVVILNCLFTKQHSCIIRGNADSICHKWDSENTTNSFITIKFEDLEGHTISYLIPCVNFNQINKSGKFNLYLLIFSI